MLTNEAVQSTFITPEVHREFKSGHVSGVPAYDILV